MDYTVHGILQARVLEWVAFPFSRGSSQPRGWTQVSCIADGFFISWATKEAHRCESWTIKEAESQRIDAFKLWWYRRLLRVPWSARRSNQSILKEINPEYSLERLMLKFQYFGHLMQRANSLEKTDAGKDWRQDEKGMTEYEMVGWHHWLDGHEFEQALGDGEGQGSLVCCSPWGCKESDMTELLNNNTCNTHP